MAKQTTTTGADPKPARNATKAAPKLVRLLRNSKGHQVGETFRPDVAARLFEPHEYAPVNPPAE